MTCLRLSLLVALVVALPTVGRCGDDTPSAERGRQALLTRHFTPATIPLTAYNNAWKVWDRQAKEPPADYAARFRDRYGLHKTPYPNDGYPMGLRLAPSLLGKALATDCM